MSTGGLEAGFSWGKGRFGAKLSLPPCPPEKTLFGCGRQAPPLSEGRGHRDVPEKGMDGCPSGNAGPFRKLPEGTACPVMTTGKGQVMGKTPDCGDRKAARALKYRQGGAAPDSGAGGTAQKTCRNEEQQADTGCPLDVLQAGQGSGSAKHPVCRLDDEGRMALPARRRRGPAHGPE